MERMETLERFVKICTEIKSKPLFNKEGEVLYNAANKVLWCYDMDVLQNFLYDIDIKHLCFITSCIAHGKYSNHEECLEMFLGYGLIEKSKPTSFFVDKIIEETDRLKHFMSAINGRR